MYALAFHLLLTLSQNCSMILVNNTVNGRSADEIKRCIELGILLAQNSGLINQTNTKQIIVVDYYSEPNEMIFNDRFKYIRCAGDSGRTGYTIAYMN